MFAIVARALKIGIVIPAGLLMAACASSSIPPTPLPASPVVTAVVLVASPVIVSAGGGGEPTGTIIANLPTSIPTQAQTNTPLPPLPTITSSGPSLVESQNNAMSFTTAVPQQVGPFTLVKNQSILSNFGATLLYRTEDGQTYQVLLWITPSAQDSEDRYNIEVGSVQAKQTLKLGDEGIYSMADTHILAVIRYRNVVIDVYRPDNPTGTVPLQKFTDDQVQQLLQKLFAALPPMGS